MKVLAIETSCDETSAAVIENGNNELSNVVLSQMDIHASFGGVVPEVASRNHVKNITMVVEDALNRANINMDNIDAIAVTYGPGLVGSLLIGLNAAKTLALVNNKPLIPVHHIASHIYANELIGDFKFPLLALVVSGGHTEFIYMKDHFSFERLGATLDDAVGECYDKVARVLELGYPGGPKLDKLSKEGEITYKLPFPLDDGSYNFSFSGLKSAVINLVHNESQRGNEIRKADLAASFQDTVSKIFYKKTKDAVLKYDIKQLVVGGGVSANSKIRETLTNLSKELDIEILIPPLKYCTDNAAMVGSAAYYKYKKDKISDLNITARPTEKLQ